MNPPIRVLIVDDNPHDRALVERELRKAFPNLQVAEAIDQKQLLGKLQHQTFDLVVTDYQLRWSNGIEVLRAVKAVMPHCPVIMFTGTGSEEIAVDAMKQGLDDYIVKKPKHLVRLRVAIASVIENARARERADRLAARLDSLLSQLDLGFFSCDRSGRILDINNEMAKLLSSLSPSDPAHLITLFSSQQQTESFLSTVIRSGETTEAEIQYGSDDHQKCIRITAKLVRINGETQLSNPLIEGLCEDVTWRKRIEFEAQKGAAAVDRLSALSPRERQVFDEVTNGNPNKVIARKLEISEKTVEKHRSNLMRKLRAVSVAELVRLSMLAEHNLVTQLSR